MSCTASAPNPSFKPAIRKDKLHQQTDAVLEKDQDKRTVHLTTWTHELKTCSDEVVVDLSLLPPGTKEGQIAELRIVPPSGTPSATKQQRVLFVVKQPPEELTKLVPGLQVRMLHLPLLHAVKHILVY